MTKDEIAALVDGWFNQNFSAGPIAHQTEAHNQLFQALPALKLALAPAASLPARAPAAPVEETE